MNEPMPDTGGAGADIHGTVEPERTPAAVGNTLVRSTRAAAAVVLCAFAALAVAYNMSVPPFEGADESTHYFYAKHVYCTGTLPVQQADAEQRGLWEQEGSQPPLYYALVHGLVGLEWLEPDLDTFREQRTPCAYSDESLTYNHQNSMGRPAVVGNENRFIDSAVHQAQGYAAAVHFIRFTSTFLGLLTLLALWSIFTSAFAARRWLAVAALALVALNPQFIHLSSTVSNDNAMNALAAVSLALLLRVIDVDGNAGRTRLARRRDAAALALAVGLAPLAKITGLVLAAFVVATLLWKAWRLRDAGALDDADADAARADARHLVATAAAVVLACLVLAGWWYVRNIRLYGSLTGLNIMLPPELRRDLNVARFFRGLPAELYGLWLSSWGIFGWFTVLLPTWVYRLIDAAALAAMAGGILSWRRRRDLRPVTPSPALGEGSARTTRWGLGAAANLNFLLVWWLLAFAALLRWMLIAKGAHGRLLFPAIAAPAVLLVLGWRALAPAKRVGDAALAAIVAVVMAALSVGALVGAIRPAYAMPRSIPPDGLPSDAVPIGVVFDGMFELAAMRAPSRAVEGTDIDVTLYWRIGENATAHDGSDRARDGYVALRWDQEVAAAEPPWAMNTVSSPPDLSYPGRGNAPFATLDRAADLVIEDVRTIRVPALATPPDWDGYRPSTLARLVVDIYDMHAQESWPSAPAVDGGPDAAFVDVALDASEPRPRRGERLAEAPGGPSARFGDAIALDVRAFDRAGAGAPQRPALPLKLGAPAPAVSGTLELAWRALAAPGEDLQMFLHVRRADGSPPVTLDGPPSRNARYPTSHWRMGDRIPSRITWMWPTPIRTGDRLTVLVGLYRLAPGTPRLPAVDARGKRYPDDAVNVAEITVR
ncbi:MAG: phospholipid carrier-dependent glycosyltransferase [Ardenticatenales bacterium]|nr:phospholipid carrier-dependent glycosyltransferase [Ardenticatenales bacterium]